MEGIVWRFHMRLISLSGTRIAPCTSISQIKAGKRVGGDSELLIHQWDSAYSSFKFDHVKEYLN
jgi:hypothetical protein